MPSTLAREATYQDVEKLIYDTVHKFRRRYGGEWDELLAEANLAYAKEYDRYITDPRRFKFSSAVRWAVWHALLDKERNDKHLRMKNRPKFVGSDACGSIVGRIGFDAPTVMGEVGGDAAVVMGLTLNPPAELAAAAEAKGGENRNLRTALRDYLAGLGWGAARIAESFAEVREALVN